MSCPLPAAVQPGSHPLLSLAPKTGGVSKWCPLQMGTQLPTSSHVYPAKPASSTKQAGLHFPQSALTVYLAKYCLFGKKKPLA